ncbi:MAG TPA: 30S ribosomal protein S8 [Planctomycetota bacterium]|nr:30S ribosomal protein S8 [Planctomycetota bacterium]
MTMTDPIADLLTRIRNGLAARRREVSMPASRLKRDVADTLKREGFIEQWELSPDGAQGRLTIKLKYGPDGERLISMIRRDSRPGRRVYCSSRDIERVLNGVGMSIYSTPAGVLSDRECRARRVGGERLATVW